MKPPTWVRRPSRTWSWASGSRNPDTTIRETGKALNISPVTVRYHLQTPRKYEFVHRYPAGQTYLYGPDEVLECWVREVGEGFERPGEG